MPRYVFLNVRHEELRLSQIKCDAFDDDFFLSDLETRICQETRLEEKSVQCLGILALRVLQGKQRHLPCFELSLDSWNGNLRFIVPKVRTIQTCLGSKRLPRRSEV